MKKGGGGVFFFQRTWCSSLHSQPKGQKKRTAVETSSGAKGGVFPTDSLTAVGTPDIQDGNEGGPKAKGKKRRSPPQSSLEKKKREGGTPNMLPA